MLADGGRGWEAEEEEEQARGNIYQIAKEKFNFFASGPNRISSIIKRHLPAFFFDKLYAPLSSIYTGCLRLNKSRFFDPC